jgi:hypothetical protein
MTAIDLETPAMPRFDLDDLRRTTHRIRLRLLRHLLFSEPPEVFAATLLDLLRASSPMAAVWELAAVVPVERALKRIAILMRPSEAELEAALQVYLDLPHGMTTDDARQILRLCRGAM